jgi:2-haloacid dehalogenase
MPEAVAFDIYGTLVDPLEMNEHLRPIVGEERADRFSELWREKQVEYTFRKALMRRYEDFGVCLEFAARALGVELSEEDRKSLIEEYQNLRPFPDVVPGIRALRDRPLVAFSNGVEATARTLLERAGVLEHLDGVISVDNVESFKPDPAVYNYLARKLEREPGEVWLVSSNPFDAIGAKAAGLRTAWVKRKPDAVFDPWGAELEPDVVVGDLEELAERIG